VTGQVDVAGAAPVGETLSPSLAHGQRQAQLPAETTEGLQRLGVVHETTLPYTPEANGKLEAFCGQPRPPARSRKPKRPKR